MELNFSALSSTVRRQRALIAIVVVAAIVCATIFLNVVRPRYTVSLDLAPVSQADTSSMSGLASLGALAGIDLNKSGGGSFKLFTAGLQSYIAAQIVANTPDLLQKMYPEEWSATEQKWVEPHSLFRSVRRGTMDMLGLPVAPWRAPGADRIYKYLQDEVVVDVSLDQPTITLRVLTPEPMLGVEFLMTLQHDVDELMRRRALDRSTQYINYLTHELQTVTVAEYRQTLAQNLAEQEKVKMMASSHISYAAEIFSGPMVSDRPTWPRAPLVLLFALVIGFICGTLASLFLDYRGFYLSLRPFGFQPLPGRP